MSKYHAQPVVVDNVRFASMKESRRYQELKLLERAGEIQHLELQPRFALHVKDTLVCHFVGDFRYWDTRRQTQVIEDTKGFRTPVYRLKKKMVEAQYGVQIVEV